MLLSADEAERWMERLQSAVRGVREGQGEQLILFGEPARIVVTVHGSDERTLGDRSGRIFSDAAEPVRHLEALLTLARAGVTVALAFITLVLFLALVFKILP